MSKPVDKLFEELKESVINGKQEAAEKLTIQLRDEKISPKDIIDNALLKGMNVVGERFRNQEIFVPHVLVAARAMKTSMKILQPMIAKDKIESKGKVLLGTVKGDVHDIGKNLVAVMLEGAGYEVIDLGIGKTVDDFLNKYAESKPGVIGLSALLTSTMTYMQEIIEGFRDRSIDIPIVVGGAPVTQKYADEIGATAFGKNSYEAVQIIDKIFAK